MKPNRDEALYLFGGLPDCRTLDKRSYIVMGSQKWEPCFCANCGASGGLVTRDTVQHFFYLCDKCAETHGRIDFPEVPEELVRGRGHAS